MCFSITQEYEQAQPHHAFQGALLAAVLATGLGLAVPQDFVPPARAESTFVTAAERRKLEAQQRKELLLKAYGLALGSPPLLTGQCARKAW
jgi:hypothetical protein